MTTTMHPDLAAELRRLGWNPAHITTWGRRVNGDAHGVTIEFEGRTHHYGGPFSVVRGGDQIAIVRR